MNGCFNGSPLLVFPLNGGHAFYFGLGPTHAERVDHHESDARTYNVPADIRVDQVEPDPDSIVTPERRST